MAVLQVQIPNTQYWAYNLTAPNATLTTASVVPATINVYTSVFSGGACSLRLDYSKQQEITVFNRGANTLTVYPPLGQQIENAGLNVGYSLTTGNQVVFTSPDPNGTFPLNWYVRT
jgi:hypothetical protein